MLRESAYIWIGPLTAMVVAQVLKPLIIMIRLRRWDWQRMRQSGGMPSSHTALVTALVTELLLRYGGRDTVLGIAILVALVVMYDAAGVRWQTGRQAAVLNRLLHDLEGQAKAGDGMSTAKLNVQATVDRIHPFTVPKVPWWLVDWPVLNEHVGHKPTEVFGGCFVGILVALAIS